MRSKRIHSMATPNLFWLIGGGVLLSFLLLLSASFYTPSEKIAGFISVLGIVIIGVTPSFRKHLKTSSSLLFSLILAYVVLCGLSTLYGYAPSIALGEFCKILFGFLTFLIIWMYSEQFGVRQIIYGITLLITVVSWIALDAASIRIIGKLFYVIITQFIPTYEGTQAGYNGNRLWGLFGNSNTMAFLCAIAVFLALYLLLTATTHKRRIIPLITLFINAFTFTMCISLGATLALSFTILLCFFFAPSRHNRITFFIVCMETIITTFLAVLASYRFFGTSSGILVFPVLLIAIAALIAIDLLLRDCVTEWLVAHKKLCRMLILLLLVICIFIAIASVSLTKSAIIEANDLPANYYLYPDSSTCTINIESEGEGTVYVYANSSQDILLGHTNLLYYNDITTSIPLTLPDETAEVMLVFYAKESPLTLHSISYTDSAGTHDIAPSYKLLPENIVSRLRNLPSNSSMIQRIMLMEDGLTLWKTTPIFGRGLGGFNNGLTSVQNFFFESQYAHNHLVQALCDLGIVGLLLYLGIFIAGFKALWSLRRKEDQQPFFMALLGALVMLFTHNTLEFNMSVGEGLFANFVVFGLIATTAKPIVLKRKVPITKVFVWATPAYFLVFAVLIIGNFAAASKMENSNYLDDLETAAKMDVFEGSDYLLTFIQYAPQTENAGYIARAEAHAEKLSKTHLSSAPSILSKFYYDIGQADKGAEMASLYLERNRSNPEAWNDMFRIFNTILDEALTGESNLDVVQCVDQFHGFYEKLIQVNQEQLDDVLLDQMSSTFVNRLLACGETTNATADTVKATMWGLLFDWNTAPDLDEDNIPDNVTVFSDLTRREDGSLEAPADLTVTVTAAPRVAGTFLVTAHCDNAALFSITSDVVQILSSEGDTYQCLIEIPDGLQDSLNDISFLLSQGCILHDLRIEYLAE